MSRQVRQDYIARIRYQNDLPAPPVPPKLLNLPSNEESYISSSLLSQMLKYGSTNIMELNGELGMPFDLTSIPGVLDRDDESKILPIKPSIQLHPKDRILLRDPSMLGRTNKVAGNVSFLRRTEYIASDGIKKRNERTSLIKHNKKEEKTDPESQLKAVEATFENANEIFNNNNDNDTLALSKLKHPTKKNLKAVSIIPILPDAEMLDLVYLNVRMIGSAGGIKKSLNDDKLDPSLDVSIFRPVTLESDEWMSFYKSDKKSSIQLKRKLSNIKNDNNENNNNENDNGKVYRFLHQRNYDMNFTRFEGTDEISISFDDKLNKAYYIPIGGRIDLKRRRIKQEQFGQQQQEDENIAAIELSLREPTTEETIMRDNQRSQFDPMNYQEMEFIEETQEQEIGTSDHENENDGSRNHEDDLE